ncbi:alpha/beta hydrolase [Flavobacterium silvisoli]|uniref:Alpha/beta hydrolase n=1 Tax=Flavobacterium silvisoli TaxID=2529433 RepID=A0A4Q9Z158_9FLAO|nr:alpha/beta hydrolase [Flavobacterium silvisoli]TBX69962.1 alpha/beta hydrolase [Flavobacterium silvisoli]
MKKIQLFFITKSIGFYLNCLSYVNAEKAKTIAYRFFSQPRKGRLHKNKLPKTLHNSTRETFTFNNENIQTYKWEGNNEIILLVHGWESNASRWKKMLPHLKKLPNTIIAIDAPAHGLTDGKEFNAPKYAEFIHVLAQQYNPKILIGHSIGGAAITYYLHKYNNDHVEKIVLLGAPSSFKKISDNFIQLLSLNTKIQTLLENYYLEKFNIHINDFSGHLFAQHFHQKAIIAHDLQDNIILVDEGRMYAQSWKNATYIETNGFGHSMHNDELYQKIAEFIAEA